MRPEHLHLFRQPGRPAVHPDGSWAVVPITRTDVDGDAYVTDLWRLDLASGGLSQLTYGTSDSSPRISPDGAWIAFVRGGDGAKPQIALMPTGGGEPRVLTDHVNAVSGPEFSPDSRRIAYTSRIPEKGRYGTDKEVGPGAEPPRLITDFSYRADGLGFRLDRPQHVFVIDVPGPADPTADVPKDEPKDAEATTENGEPKGGGEAPPSGAIAATGVAPVQVTEGPLSHYGPVWLTADELLVRRDIVDGMASTLLRVAASAGAEVAEIGTPGHGPEDIAVGPGGEIYLLVVDYGEDGYDFIGKRAALYRGTLAGAELSDLERLTDPEVESLNGAVFRPTPHGVLLTREHRGTVQLVRWADGGLQVLVGGNRSVAAAEPVGVDGAVLAVASAIDSLGDVLLVGADGAERRLTDLSARLRAEAGVHEPAELEVSADDGYPVHGWVATPPGPGPHPVLLLIHGGPYAAYEPTFFDEVQTYVSAGYGVVFCNPRGSASYGQEHGRAIIGGFGQRDAADVRQFLDGALAAHPELDATRIGVMGGSYGGYMTAWLTTQEHRWAGAIVERGFLDPVSFVGSSDIGWFFGLRYLGEDPELVAAQSPMARIESVTTPTLVIHSEHDWRCPVEQGQRWYVGLKRQGVPTELLLFPGEGHELSRSGTPKHRLARFEHILRWWETYLPVAAAE